MTDTSLIFKMDVIESRDKGYRRDQIRGGQIAATVRQHDSSVHLNLAATCASL